jgi:transposase
LLREVTSTSPVSHDVPMPGVTFTAEPTNWEGEQAIRPAVVNRKVWGGNRTWPGARAQGVLMSVLETCKRAGRSGLDFVSQTLRAFSNPLVPRPILLATR